MLKQIRSHFPCRVLAALLLPVLAACSEQDVVRAGAFELSTSSGAACDAAPPGELRLEGLDAPAHVLVSDAELCAGMLLRRELPPGLYALSWQSAAHDGPREPELLRGPAVVSLFSGQVTRLRVELQALPGVMVSSATPSSEPGAERPVPPSVCSGDPDGSGAS